MKATAIGENRFDERRRSPQHWLRNWWAVAVFFFAALLGFSPQVAQSQEPKPAARPNVILIMTDDLGYGDLGVTGNPIVRTPNIDQLASESASVERFYVSPVCAPTRACLMTGRYNYRTRAIDTYIGRAMMEPEEVTIAEVLQQHGYATGIFGKWHLGDNYPMRPMDQGFDVSLVHRGGGIGQPSDPPESRRRYTNPVLFRNGVAEQCEGYCTDVYYDNAMQFIEDSIASDEPFFAYLPDNCPHGPFHDVPADLKEYYQSLDLRDSAFPQEVGHPLTGNPNLETRAAIFAMVENIDRNIGRLRRRLEELGVADNTVVIFMSDNGPQGRRYVSGFAGSKSSVYEGGIRSPLFVHWPGVLEPGFVAKTHAAHIDMSPTLLEVCGVELGQLIKFDGRSILPDLRGQSPDSDATDRTIYIQSHRGDVPIRYHHFAAIGPRWKLVHHSGFGREEGFADEPNLELFDLQEDPFEEHNVAEQQSEVVKQMLGDYDKWFDDVSSTRDDNYAPPRIVIGSPHETTSVLTRQDWRHRKGGKWARNSHGVWEVTFAREGSYDILCRYAAEQTAGVITLRIGGVEIESGIRPGSEQHTFSDVKLVDGEETIEVLLTHQVTDDDGNKQLLERGPHQLEVRLSQTEEKAGG